METDSKQQVVFIARTLWGGGVEKVLYELAHGLDREHFTPIVIYLLEENNLFPYDPSISTICLQPKQRPEQPEQREQPKKREAGLSSKQKLSRFLHRIYNAMPLSIRLKIKLRERLSSIEQKTKELPKVDSEVVSSFISFISRYEIPDAIAEVWPQVVTLRAKLNEFNENAVFIPLEETNTVILWLACLRKTHVLASHHVPYSWAQKFRYPDEQVRQVNEWLYLNACRAATIVAFPSEGARKDLNNNFGIPIEKTIYLPDPIDCDAIIKKSQEQLPVELVHLGRKTIFAQVARLSLEKAPLLVDACDILRKRYDDFIVMYIGDGVLYEPMQKKIREKHLENHIMLLGEKANPYPYMVAARALLLTSKTEGFGLVLAEAMLCGSVPISTDCDGPRDLLGDNQYGLIVQQDNPQEFADAMYQIATDDNLYMQLREKGRDRAFRFDTHRVVKEWEEVIIKVAENKVDT